MKRFAVEQGWKLLLNDAGLNSAEVLKKAGLPGDLFNRLEASLASAEYFRLWDALSSTSADPAIGLTLVKTLTADVFSPPLFAAYCSPNLNVALQRLSQYKPLIGPVRLLLDQGVRETSVTIDVLDTTLPMPDALVAAESCFFVQLARMATREQIVPVEVTAPIEFEPRQRYVDFFGIEPRQGKRVSLSFSAESAALPFITENRQMWEFFEPGLKKRLSELTVKDDFSSRVRSALLELLPAGQSSVDIVASRLAVNKRTLQRRLSDEQTNFQKVLNGVREELASYYLKSSTLSHTQISFLLGFSDPNSFYRAFHDWTGSTPETVRAQALT